MIAMRIQANNLDPGNQPTTLTTCLIAMNENLPCFDCTPAFPISIVKNNISLFSYNALVQCLKQIQSIIV